uniref:Uncharacterized protein n=1 Tax=Acrobeloides nanus TaxID=290746 RepID=A0A914DTJ5_9BILA
MSAKNRPGKVVELLRSLWLYSGEPLRVVEVDSFLCIYPFCENVFNDYINSSIIYLEFDPFTELSRFLTNFNNFKLWPLTKKVFIRCCNNQNIGNNVDILLNFFDLLKDGTRLNLSLDNINNPSILIPLFEHIITSFEQAADRQKLLHKFGLVRVICPTDIFERFLTRMNQKMKLAEEIIEEINSEYFGMIRKDGWKLYITIQVKRYPSSYNIVYIHIHTNIIQEIEA